MLRSSEQAAGHAVSKPDLPLAPENELDEEGNRLRPESMCHKNHVFQLMNSHILIENSCQSFNGDHIFASFATAWHHYQTYRIRCFECSTNFCCHCSVSPYHRGLQFWIITIAFLSTSKNPSRMILMFLFAFRFIGSKLSSGFTCSEWKACENAPPCRFCQRRLTINNTAEMLDDQPAFRNVCIKAECKEVQYLFPPGHYHRFRTPPTSILQSRL